MTEVKSAKRVLELFEFFAERRTPASAGEIAEALGYPQSSTSVLLQTLVALGYLDHDRRGRLFVPNVRLALISNWLQVVDESDASVSMLMERLRTVTRESVILGVQKGLRVQYAFVLETQEQAIRWHLPIGISRPLLHAALGQVLLAAKPVKEARRLVWQCNAESEAGQQVDIPAFEKRLERIRHQGYAESDGTLTAGAMVCAVMLPPSLSAIAAEPCAIGIGGPIERIRSKREQILSALHEIVRGAGEPMERKIPAPIRPKPHRDPSP